MIEKQVSVRDVSYFVREKGSGIPIVFLHGFLGSVHSFDDSLQHFHAPNYRLVMIDCLGHGRSSKVEKSTRFYDFEQVRDLHEIFLQLQIEKPILVGYSMGGRLALSYARTFPNELRGCILESSTPGIIDKEEREKRVIEDSVRARFIRENGLKAFLIDWNNLLLFSGLQAMNPEKKKLYEIMKENQSPGSMAASLEGFSTGVMQSHWDELSKWNFPVLILVGEKDEKFSLIAKKMHKLLKNSKVTIVENCGHAIHMEQSEKFGKIVSDACKNFFR